MENTILNIYSADTYGKLHLEPSTATSSFLWKFAPGGGKNDTSCNSLKSLLFHLHYAHFCRIRDGRGAGLPRSFSSVIMNFFLTNLTSFV